MPNCCNWNYCDCNCNYDHHSEKRQRLEICENCPSTPTPPPSPCPPCCPCPVDLNNPPVQDGVFNDIGVPLIPPTFELTPNPTPKQILETPYLSEEEIDPDPYVGQPRDVNPIPLNPIPKQYTPTHSKTSPSDSDMMKSLTSVSISSPGNLRHDPDGITWMTPAQWAPTAWDGIPFDPTDKSKEQICEFLGENPYRVKGLRERFYEVNPFTDNENPTIAEINDWNLEVIRHFRNLLNNDTPVDHDARLYLEARWADERKYTKVWDAEFPAPAPGSDPPSKPGWAYGPCFIGDGKVDLAGGHCGASFFPDENDRDEYISAEPYNSDFTEYPELKGYTNRASRTEGIASVNPAGVPWSIKLAFIIRNWICSEGLKGHAGPYVGKDARELFGSSWWYDGGAAHFRGKWR